MRSTPSLWVTFAFLALFAGHSSSGEKPLRKRPSPGITLQESTAGSLLRFSPAAILYEWTFDNGGAPDPQGWTTSDATLRTPYFHIDDFSTEPGFTALQGTKSLWCGRPACEIPGEVCYASSGYGNDWDQRFVTIPLIASGPVDVSFQIKWDTEPGYDYIYLEFSDADTDWGPVSALSGQGNTTIQFTIPPELYTSPIRFRFRFASDGVYSDEDGLTDTQGAAIIDAWHVAANGLTIDSQDFETESAGATSTADGVWSAPPVFGYGDYAALVGGGAVLQEDVYGVTNGTHLWSFFNGSAANYGCGGHPEQTAIPFPVTLYETELALENRIESPPVSLAAIPANHPLVLSFDVYEDLPFYNMVSYVFAVRSRVDGLWRPWRTNGLLTFSDTKSWVTRSFNMRPLIHSAATEIQVGIVAVDACPYFCDDWGFSGCHSHSPLIDNVRVIDGNTFPGSPVVLNPVDETTGTTPVEITFQNVTTGGNTTLVTGATGPAMPGAFMIADNTYYNISTTAVTTGNISVCITYNEAALVVPEASLRMLHWDTDLNPDAWVDVTDNLDTVSNTICGVSDDLSPFVIGTGSLTGVEDGSSGGFALHQNVPNPFNPATTITYDVPAGGAHVALRIYDAAGRLVRTLVDETRPAGTQAASWDGRNASGTVVSSGVYFYRLTADGFSQSRRMVLLK